MKFVLWGVIGLLSLQAQASRVTVIGPCSQAPIFQAETSSQASTLGDLTVEVFQKNHLSFDGSRDGIRSIANSPVGDEALEILSDSQMRAYGWCVSVNGVEPDRMPSDVPLRGIENEIVWFYAFSFYDHGEWKNPCTPSYKVQSLSVCQKK